MTVVTLRRLYFLASGLVFFLVAIFHLLRIIFLWPIAVGGAEIPMMLSYAGLPTGMAAAALAAMLARKRD
jgi:hypothetical protein